MQKNRFLPFDAVFCLLVTGCHRQGTTDKAADANADIKIGFLGSTHNTFDVRAGSGRFAGWTMRGFYT